MGADAPCMELGCSCPPPLQAGALGGAIDPLGEQNEDWGERNTLNNSQCIFQAAPTSLEQLLGGPLTPQRSGEALALHGCSAEGDSL